MMREQFKLYVIRLYQDIPANVYEGLLIGFCIGTIVLLALCGIKKGIRISAGLLLLEYIALIFMSTFYYRDCLETVGHNFHPLWSYNAILDGRTSLIEENIMNVLVFIPVGILLGCAFLNMKWWKALVIGCGISLSIEVLQYSFNRGFAETDDVMHNTLGCLIGLGLYKAAVLFIGKLLVRK